MPGGKDRNSVATPRHAPEQAIRDGAPACAASPHNASQGGPDVAVSRESGRKMEAALQELKEAKSRLVAEASHELRTPLSIVREFVSLVRDGTMGPIQPKQADCLDTALRNCDRLAQLVEGMLDLARIEAGKAGLHRDRTDLASLATECRDEFLSRCRAKDQQLLMETPSGIPPAHCDGKSIRRVLTNLLDNAVKYTQTGGTIRLRFEHDARFVTVSVADNGPGFPAEFRDRIFEPFFRGVPAIASASKGSGLGLAICKNLVEANGGYISADSPPQGGCVFRVSLPVFEEAPAYRVLIADDDEQVLQFAGHVLRKSGLKFDIKTTGSSVDSLVIAGQFRPHLVILDIHFEELQGDHVLRSLRRIMPEDPPKVLLISGSRGALRRVDTSIADGFLEKPFGGDDLVRKVVMLLGIERRKG
jgi:signal transduction histidine kinase/CheY-like chemotaxis protein